MSAKIQFDRKCLPAPDYVVLKVLSQCDKMELDGIEIPDQAFSNDKLGRYVVEAVGSNAEKEYGLAVGDYVVADRLAAVYPSEPICIMKYINVIAKANWNFTKFFPLKNMVFVVPDKKSVSDVGGILVQNYAKDINTGRIVAINLEEGLDMPYDVGDTVLLSRGADNVQIGGQDFRIYKHDMLVCKIFDDKTT